MKDKDARIIKNILGDDIFIDLEKNEIYKPGTKSTVDPEDIKIALQIVPRSVLSFLFSNLKYKNIGDIVDLDLPFALNSQIHINKLGPDNYKGEIIQNGRVVSEFQHRSLPSIGLILLTTFELYDISLLDEIKKNPSKEESDRSERLQDLIDERLSLHKLVQEVVDKKVSERDAINRMIREKLHSHVLTINSIPEEHYEQEDGEEKKEDMDKKSRLRRFLESKEKKRQEEVELDKSELKCQDCGTSLYKEEDENSLKLCVCYGEYMGKSIKFVKTEEGKVKFKFPKSFDIDNIEMLLDTIIKK